MKIFSSNYVSITEMRVTGACPVLRIILAI